MKTPKKDADDDDEGPKKPKKGASDDGDDDDADTNNSTSAVATLRGFSLQQREENSNCTFKACPLSTCTTMVCGNFSVSHIKYFLFVHFRTWQMQKQTS
jgi:hypothetical protein